MQNSQTFLGYILHILQYFLTKLHHFTKFRMLFPAVPIFPIQRFVKGKWSIALDIHLRLRCPSSDNTSRLAPFFFHNIPPPPSICMSDYIFSACWDRRLMVFCERVYTVLGDLKTRKRTGTSCQIEIHFSSQTWKFLINYNLLRFQISGGLIIFFTEHDYKVSTSFIKENKRYK